MQKIDTLIGVICSIEINDMFQLCSLLHKDFILTSPTMLLPIRKGSFMKIHEHSISGLYDFNYSVTDLVEQDGIVKGRLKLNVKMDNTADLGNSGIPVIGRPGVQVSFAPTPFEARIENDEILELMFFSTGRNDLASFLEDTAKSVAIKELVN